MATPDKHTIQVDTMDSTIEEPESPESSQSPWACYLPKELLLSIFQCSASKWGPVPLICRACQVCRLWREVAHDPSLWRQLDLSSGWIRKNVLGLMSLRMSGCFQVVRSLNLTAWWSLLDHHLEIVLAACPNLTHLNISHCQALTDSGIHALADSAPILSHLDMTHMAPLATSISSMRQLIVKIGPHLQRLNISSNVFTHKFSNILLLITVHCSDLKALLMNDIHVAGSVKVPLDIHSMQTSIAGLEELNIESTPFIALSALFEEGPGFPSLQSYTAHAHNSNQDEEDQLFIERILSNSCSLKTMILRECLGTLNLQTLVCTDLQIIALPNSIHWLEILPHLRRWQHSLIELDLSWCKGHWRMVEASFQRLLQPGITFPALHSINLSGTNITGRTLSPLLESCPRLKELVLIGCRSLPTAWCRHFTGSTLTEFKRQAFGD